MEISTQIVQCNSSDYGYVWHLAETHNVESMLAINPRDGEMIKASRAVVFGVAGNRNDTQKYLEISSHVGASVSYDFFNTKIILFVPTSDMASTKSLS